MRARRYSANLPVFLLAFWVVAWSSGGSFTPALGADSPPTSPAPATGGALWGAAGTTLRAAGDGYLLEDAAGTRRLELPRGVVIDQLFALRQAVFLSALRAGERRAGLYLALADGSGLHALPVPAAEADRARENAVPLASPGGDLEGLVWLEGTNRQSYSIRYAAWNGLSWSEPTEVAPPAPGSQLALAATVLDDGSQLAVWSRFDGSDDEIVASRFVDGRWSAPAPLAADNAVPDVTPTVLAVAGGALASWSRYDGHEYRLVVSRFDGRAWTPPVWIGPVGGGEPALSRATGTGGELWLSYASGHPRGWGVLVLDRAGRVRRQGVVASTSDVRPALAPTSSGTSAASGATGGVRLRWAGSEVDLPLQ